MTRRYFAPQLPSAGGIVELDADEAQHAARVMRAKPGDSLVLFDGRGHESAATIRSVDKRQCVVSTLPPEVIDRETGCRLHLAIALPKPERSKEMIERLSELGVAAVTPLICDRTQRPPSDSLLEKLRRVVIESCKQSGRNLLMEIRSPQPLSTYLQSQPDGLRMIAHPDGEHLPSIHSEFITADAATILIGPEGGFTDQEVTDSAGCGYRKIGLGKRIYRIETAACVCATFFS